LDYDTSLNLWRSDFRDRLRRFAGWWFTETAGWGKMVAKLEDMFMRAAWPGLKCSGLAVVLLLVSGAASFQCFRADGDQVNLLATGTCKIKATQAGQDLYPQAPATRLQSDTSGGERCNRRG
jgi:hypothetical protein